MCGQTKADVPLVSRFIGGLHCAFDCKYDARRSFERIELSETDTSAKE